MAIDEQFDALARETIKQASRLKCSIQEYSEGLQQIAEELLTAADAAEGDARRLAQKDQEESDGQEEAGF